MTPPAHTYHDTGVARAEAMDGWWRAEAACKGMDTNIFFRDTGENLEDAKKVCREQCSVRAECLEYALVANVKFGLWGGLSEKERRREKQKRKRRGRAA